MQRNGEPKEILELNRITKKRILELCKKNKLYQTPELNDVLYLHYQGFESIECLEDYTELKCLWLECNAISEIQGLKKQPKLKCLFLQSNLIRKIENLEYCKELDTINLSQNQIRKIENCGYEILPALNTLNLSSNYIKDCEGLKELENCKNLSVLDLSNNRIDDILVVKIFSKMPELKVLVLQGNPVVSKIPQYRKTLILECVSIKCVQKKKLTYLDSRPVFPKDRACAEAWKRGGYQEERKENERWNRKERKKMRDGVNATIQLRNKNRKPEDLISLIPSSDSEDDTHVRNQNKPITENSDVIIDSIWDEVSDDKYSESSVTQKSPDGSSESFITESKSTLESIKQDERNNINNLNDYNEKASKLSENHNIDVKLDKKCESIDHKQKQIEIQKSDQNFEATELYGTNNEISSIETDMNHYYISTDTHTVSEEKNQSSFEATHCLPKSENLSESSFKRIKLYIENDLVDTENYEPLKELEETMNILETYEGDGESSAQHLNVIMKKTSLKLQNEEECLKINQELRKDFEKLSKNMDNSVEQLDRDKDERKEFNQVLFNKNQSSPERKSESSGNELMDHNIKGNNLEVTINRLDKKCKLKENQVGAKLPQIIINDEKTIANREELIKGIQNPNDVHMQQFIRKKDHEEETIESRLCATDTFSKQDSIKLKESNIKLREENSEADIFALQTTSSLLINHSQKPDNSDDFSYIPLNISLLNYKSNEALNSFENEANELKKLLHKLETQNEILFNDINTEDKCQTEECNQENNEEDNEENKMSKNKSFNENDEKSFGNINDDDNISALEPNTCHETNLDKLLEPVISLILDEIIQSLELTSSLQPRQNEFQKSIEFEEAYNCPETVRHPINETNSESIPMFIKSFRQFFKDINNENFREFKKDKQKSLVLKRMTKQTDLKRFHNESPECLNAQLEKFKREQNANICHMIDRVYTQKDRYNDTLELNDEKLMVRNKDTGELQELSKPLKYHMNNSDTDYDTAQSEDQKDKAKYQSLESSQANCKPTFNTSENLITRAIYENNLLRDNDNSEDSNDEFYSLEAQDKPNLYNIDREFFNKLQLEDLNISERDENHIVQCSRSYEELKQYLKISKEKRCLSAEENELLENMIEKKCIKPNENSRISKNFFETKERKWFDKMVRNSNERQKQGNMETLPDVSYKPSSPGIKIFEYKNDTSVQTCFPSQWEELYRDLDTNITTEMYGSGVYTFTYKNSKEETANKYEVDKNELYVSKISDEENIPQKISSYLSTVDIGEEEDGEIESNVDVESVRSVIKKMN